MRGILEITLKHRNGYQPILRWAGGKNWLLKYINRLLPNNFNNYHEPFLGGGSVFFYLNPDGKSYLSDTNPELINTFCQIRDNVEEVIFFLNQYTNTKDEYYRARKIRHRNLVKKAAQFIFLNRTCFNGIYRVNLKGQYNVPYGFKKYRKLFELGRFRDASDKLQNVTIERKDFSESIKNIQKGDLIFLDPPYVINHKDNGFIRYNEKLFSWYDQERLAEFILQIKQKNAYYILTNADHKSVNTLFGDIDKPIRLHRSNVIGGRYADRGEISEFIFTNVSAL